MRFARNDRDSVFVKVDRDPIENLKFDYNNFFGVQRLFVYENVGILTDAQGLGYYEGCLSYQYSGARVVVKFVNKTGEDLKYVIYDHDRKVVPIFTINNKKNEKKIVPEVAKEAVMDIGFPIQIESENGPIASFIP